MARPIRQAQFFQIIHGQFAALAVRDSLIIKGEFHVFHGRLEANQVEALENETYHPVPVVCRLLFGKALHEGSVQKVLPGVVIVQDAEDVEKGGFSGPRSPHDGHKLPFLYTEVYPLQDMQRLPVIVGLVDVFEMNERHTFCCISMLLHCKYRTYFLRMQIFLQKYCHRPGRY